MSRCGCLLNSSVIISCVIGALFISLAPFYGLYIRNNEEDREDTILDVSISSVLSYTPSQPYKLVIPLLMFIGNIFMVIAALGRKIQIRIIFDRATKYNGIVPFINVFNCIILVCSSLIWLAAIGINTFLGKDFYSLCVSISFLLALSYHLIHIILTFIQRCKCEDNVEGERCVAWLCKQFDLFYLILGWVTAVIFVLFYAYIVYNNNDNKGDDGDHSIPYNIDESMIGIQVGYGYEWMTVWLINSFYFILGYFFIRDPIKDELIEFFSPRCKSSKDSNDIEMEMAINM